MQEHKPKYFQFIIVGVLIVTGIILTASLFKNDDITILPESNEAVDETTKIVEAQNYEFMLPSDWEFYENALEDIQELAEGQIIKFGIVRDPIENNYVYFASTADINEKESIASIYKYNETDYSFERIWRKSYNAEEMGEVNNMDEYWPELYVIGYENGKLITLMQESYYSPGPCANPWLMGWADRPFRNMLTIDLSNPYAGLEEYTPNDEVIENAKKDTSECMKDF